MKIFSNVWLHFKKCFKKYFLVFSCVLENTIKNTFSTCCSHFLSFSQLPNKYIISFLNTETQTKPRKKIIKFGQIGRRRNGERRLGSTRGCDRRGASRDCERREGVITISAVLRAILMISAISVISTDDLYSLLFLSLSLSLSLAFSLFCAWPGNGLKVKWKCKTISRSKE